MSIILKIPVRAPVQETKNISRDDRKRISAFRAPKIRKIPNSSLLNFINRIETAASTNTLIRRTEKMII